MAKYTKVYEREATGSLLILVTEEPINHHWEPDLSLPGPGWTRTAATLGTGLYIEGSCQFGLNE